MAAEIANLNGGRAGDEARIDDDPDERGGGHDEHEQADGRERWAGAPQAVDERWGAGGYGSRDGE
jgi:hypothetical protein